MAVAFLSACKSKSTGIFSSTKKPDIEVLASEEINPALKSKAYGLGKKIQSFYHSGSHR